MPSHTKITLSEQERQLVTDAGWILTKRAIIDKVYQLMGQVADELQAQVAADAGLVPAGVGAVAPRIYRGENYRQLPYVLLDYPRYFKGEDVFALRTLFWWGNFFSVTLHLGGACKADLLPQLQQQLGTKSGEDLYICVNSDPWEHHFEAENYQPAGTLQPAVREELSGRNFLKLAYRFPLDNWEEMPAILSSAGIRLLQLLIT